MNELKKRESIKTKMLMASVGTDETRLFLMSVCHVSDVKALVSMNGHAGTILKSRYSEELSDKIICPKTYQIIRREYPRIANVIPNISKGTKYKLKIEKHHYSKDAKIYIFEQDIGNAFLSFEKESNGGKFLACIQARYLKHLNIDMWINIKFYNEDKPILFDLTSIDNIEWSEFEDIYLVMPMRV